MNVFSLPARRCQIATARFFPLSRALNTGNWYGRGSNLCGMVSDDGNRYAPFTIAGINDRNWLSIKTICDHLHSPRFSLNRAINELVNDCAEFVGIV